MSNKNVILSSGNSYIESDHGHAEWYGVCILYSIEVFGAVPDTLK